MTDHCPKSAKNTDYKALSIYNFQDYLKVENGEIVCYVNDLAELEYEHYIIAEYDNSGRFVKCRFLLDDTPLWDNKKFLTRIYVEAGSQYKLFKLPMTNLSIYERAFELTVE